MNYKFIIVEKLENRVGRITLNRPKVYNALCNGLMEELSNAIIDFDNDESVGAIILTGGDKVFAAGADINELNELSFSKAYGGEFVTKEWRGLENHTKPIIAAVSGFALGGGCEMALMCDIIICSTSAKFGQPEVKIGTMPGAGGTQRLTRAVGKAKSMLMCLTGEMIDANEAKAYQLVAEVCENEELMNRAINIATQIASMSKPVVRMIKESVNNAYESPLNSALKRERHLFYSTLALEDRVEGTSAFLEKRRPNFQDK